MTALTDPQIAALQWLFDNGGTGVINRYGAVIAGGEKKSNSHAVTFLRLFASNHLIGDGQSRIRLSALGLGIVEKVKPNPTHAQSQRDWSDPRIREAFIGDEDTITDFDEPRL